MVNASEPAVALPNPTQVPIEVVDDLAEINMPGTLDWRLKDPEPPPIQRADKVSWTRPNPANAIEAWLAAKWPDFPKLPCVWITGSSVWRHVYGEEVEPDADLDIFVSRNGHPYVSLYWSPNGTLRTQMQHAWVRQITDAETALLAWARKHETAPPIENAKLTTSLGGTRVYTSKGSFDIWQANGTFVRDQIGNYPPASHAHCKAAFCPATRELIIMPNDAATPDGAFEDLERRATQMMERAQAQLMGAK